MIFIRSARFTIKTENGFRFKDKITSPTVEMHGKMLTDKWFDRSNEQQDKIPISHGWRFIFLLFGFLNLISALWMLISPEHWYYNLPVGIPESGPLNIHFIRDIGCIFLLLGCALVMGAFSRIEFRLVLFTMNTSFCLLHMCVHIHELVSGRLRMGIFWTDLPSIYLPALLMLILNIILIRQYQSILSNMKSKPMNTEI